MSHDGMKASEYAKLRKEAHDRWLQDILTNPSPALKRKLKRVKKLHKFQGR